MANRHRSPGLGARVRRTVLAVAAASVLAVVVVLAGDSVGTTLRRGFDRLRPQWLLAAVAVVALVTAVLRVRPGDPRVAAVRRRASALGRGIARAVDAVPAGVALPFLVAAAASLRIALDRAITLPRVFADELIYSALAKSIATGAGYVVRGETDTGHGLVYPLVISPAYALASDGASAYALVQGANAVAMALTAVPVYYLARRVLTHGWSLSVAALSVAGPWSSYASLVMTESLFYPLFATFALVLVLTLEHPSTARQLGTLALLGLIVGVRTQGVALAGAVLTAIGLHALIAGSARRTLRAFRLTLAVTVVAALAGGVVWLAGAASPLGAYDVLFETHDVLGTLKWAAWNATALEFALGVVALAAFPVAVAHLLRRSATSASRAVGSVALSVSVWMLASVALLSATPHGLGRLHERSLFYVTPLVLVCFARWLADRPARPSWLLVTGAGAAVALPLLTPASLFRQEVVDALSVRPWAQLGDTVSSLPLKALLVALAVGGAVALLCARKPALPLAALVAGLFATNAVVNNLVEQTSRKQASRLAWVDRAPRDGQPALLVHVGLPEGRCPPVESDWSEGELSRATEFFNVSVDRVVHVLEDNLLTGRGSPRVDVAPDGTLRDGGRAVEAAFVVADSRVPFAGTRIAALSSAELASRPQERVRQLTLWRTSSPVRVLEPQLLRRPAVEELGCSEPPSGTG